MTSRFLKSAVAAAMTFTLAACPGGDSTTGPQIQLTEAQTEDMMDALDAIGSAGADGFRIASAAVRQSLAAHAQGAALFTLPIDETEDCPAGGTTHVSGSVTASDDFTSGSADFTQTYSNCKASSSSGTLWTFNSAPSLHFSGSFTATGGSGTMKGTIAASSSMGSGNCTVDLTYNENETSYSATGTICGKPFSESETF